ncbi:hypothetical protein TNCV_1384341 [Trichonephila clavipes]|nr:hypothetical protein TNCV_1384341 [Trichonephila clavipes]
MFHLAVAPLEEPRGIQTHRFFISREISCIEQLRLYSAEDGDVMFQWTVVLDLELDDGRRDCCRGCSYRIHETLCFTQPQESSLRWMFQFSFFKKWTLVLDQEFVNFST